MHTICISVGAWDAVVTELIKSQKQKPSSWGIRRVKFVIVDMPITNNKKSSKLMSTKKMWKTDIKKWSSISEKTAALMIAEGELALKETLEVQKSISAKAERIISLLIPAISALTIYLMNVVQEKGLAALGRYLPLCAALSVGLLLVSVSFTYVCFKEYKAFTGGEYPKNLVTSMFIDNEFNHSEQYLNMVISICENIQLRIDENDSVIRFRMRFHVASTRVLLALPLCPILAYFLSA